MPKRKLIALLLLWQVAGGSYLSPAEDEAQLTAWRELDPRAKIIFLRNWTSRGAAHELACPRRVEMKDDGYCVVDAIHSNETEYKIGKMKLKWVDDHLEYLGTRICEACFRVGKLSPVTCVKHVKCGHKRKEKNLECLGCVSKTFAGHWADKVKCWHPTKNGDLRPWDVGLHVHKKYWFSCRECGHDFEISPHDIVGKKWCSYCVNLKRCMENDCKSCFLKSFASHPKSIYWHACKNGDVLPRAVALHDNKKYYFTCGECFHDFDTSPDKIVSRNRWCPYCTNQKRCMEKDCDTCLLKSFASHPRAAYWHVSKNGKITPRQISLNNGEKYCFTCTECDYDFNMSPNAIVSNDSWCPYCCKSGRALCGNIDCLHCRKNSLAFFDNAETLKSYEEGGNVLKTYEIALYRKKIANWKCNQCRNIFERRVCDVTRGRWCTRCYSNLSYGEKACLDYLKKNNIHLIQQFRIRELNSKWRYDFYFELSRRKFILEFDGAQHFIQGFGVSDEEFANKRERDILKSHYVVNNGFFLIRISYNRTNVGQQIDQGIQSSQQEGLRWYFSDPEKYAFILNRISNTTS